MLKVGKVCARASFLQYLNLTFRRRDAIILIEKRKGILNRV